MAIPLLDDSRVLSLRLISTKSSFDIICCCVHAMNDA
jgi:hypothetical protein